MVCRHRVTMGIDESFQYSLCRVVLMVLSAAAGAAQAYRLSVLALSSRFDGP